MMGGNVKDSREEKDVLITVCIALRNEGEDKEMLRRAGSLEQLSGGRERCKYPLMLEELFAVYLLCSTSALI